MLKKVNYKTIFFFITIALFNKVGIAQFKHHSNISQDSSIVNKMKNFGKLFQDENVTTISFLFWGLGTRKGCMLVSDTTKVTKIVTFDYNDSIKVTNIDYDTIHYHYNKILSMIKEGEKINKNKCLKISHDIKLFLSFNNDFFFVINYSCFMQNKESEIGKLISRCLTISYKY